MCSPEIFTSSFSIDLWMFLNWFLLNVVWSGHFSNLQFTVTFRQRVRGKLLNFWNCVWQMGHLSVCSLYIFIFSLAALRNIFTLQVHPYPHLPLLSSPIPLSLCCLCQFPPPPPTLPLSPWLLLPVKTIVSSETVVLPLAVIRISH